MHATAISMPLLVKDLAQMSGRKSTYRFRLWTGLFLTVPAMVIILQGWMDSSTGMGADLARLQYGLLYTIVWVLLPVIAADAIIAERENRSLPLLLLTRLSTWDVVLQKYLARVVPMAALLLLSAPVMAVAYAYGGISLPCLLKMMLALSLQSLYVTAIAIFCSARCRTTTAAVVVSYLLIWIGSGMATFFLGLFGTIATALASGPYAAGTVTDWVSVSLFPFITFSSLENPWTDIVTSSLPMAATTLLFLLLANISVRRPSLDGDASVPIRFREMDARADRINRFLGNVRFGGDVGILPSDSPVAWRELTRLRIARPRDVVRLLLGVEIPAALFALMEVAVGADTDTLILNGFIVWIPCALALSVAGARMFPGERTHQTLEILLTVPLDAGEIVQQKYAALKRFFIILLAPSVTVLLPLLSEDNLWLFCLMVLGVVGVLREFMFIGLRSGLRYPNRLQAIAVAIAWSFLIAVLWGGLVAMSAAAIWFGVTCGVPVMLVATLSASDIHATRATQLLDKTRSHNQRTLEGST